MLSNELILLLIINMIQIVIYPLLQILVTFIISELKYTNCCRNTRLIRFITNRCCNRYGDNKKNVNNKNTLYKHTTNNDINIIPTLYSINTTITTITNINKHIITHTNNIISEIQKSPNIEFIDNYIKIVKHNLDMLNNNNNYIYNYNKSQIKFYTTDNILNSNISRLNNDNNNILKLNNQLCNLPKGKLHTADIPQLNNGNISNNNNVLSQLNDNNNNNTLQLNKLNNNSISISNDKDVLRSNNDISQLDNDDKKIYDDNIKKMKTYNNENQLYNLSDNKSHTIDKRYNEINNDIEIDLNNNHNNHNNDIIDISKSNIIFRDMGISNNSKYNYNDNYDIDYNSDVDSCNDILNNKYTHYINNK